MTFFIEKIRSFIISKFSKRFISSQQLFTNLHQQNCHDDDFSTAIPQGEIEVNFSFFF